MSGVDQSKSVPSGRGVSGTAIWAGATVLIAGIVAYTVIETRRPIEVSGYAPPAYAVPVSQAPTGPLRIAAEREVIVVPEGVVAPQAGAPVVAPTASPDVFRQARPSPAVAVQPAAVPASGVLAATNDPDVWVISDPETGKRMIELIAQLPSVPDMIGGAQSGSSIQAFFDPRCPYCHKAFDLLNGKVAINWIPASVLGDPAGGNAIARSILASPDRVAGMKAALNGEKLVDAVASAEADAQLGASFEVFAQITQLLQGAGSQSLGVPTFLVPGADGKVRIVVGYDDKLIEKLTALKRG